IGGSKALDLRNTSVAAITRYSAAISMLRASSIDTYAKYCAATVASGTVAISSWRSLTRLKSKSSGPSKTSKLTRSLSVSCSAATVVSAFSIIPGSTGSLLCCPRDDWDVAECGWIGQDVVQAQIDKALFVHVLECLLCLYDIEPPRLVHFVVVIGSVAREIPHQIEGNRFLVLGAIQVEPVRDIVEFGDDFSPAARLLTNFAQCGLLVRFFRLDVTLRQRPNARRAASDEQCIVRRLAPA